MYTIYKLYLKSDIEKIPKYIGITSINPIKRLKEHFYAARYNRKIKRNTLIGNWILSAVDKGDDVLIETIDTALTKQDAWDKEIFYIHKFKSEGLILKNTTLGGEGFTATRIKQFSKTGELIKTWPSLATIGRELNINTGNIASCLKGLRGSQTAYDFIWKYENESYLKTSRRKNAYIESIKKHICQLDSTGRIIKEWSDALSVWKETGIYRKGVTTMCNSIHNLENPLIHEFYGYYWCFKQDYENVNKALKNKSLLQKQLIKYYNLKKQLENNNVKLKL